MVGKAKYFFDTYAIIAMLENAPGYAKFNFSDGQSTLINLMEVQYSLLRGGSEDSKIKKTISDLLPMCIGFSEDDCFDAAKLKFLNKQKRLSYTDCLGYILAKKEGVPFVTGDMAFEGMPNVEFARDNCH